MAENPAAAAVNLGAGLRLPETSSRCVMESGAHNFEVTNYALLEGLGVGKYIASSTFRVGGYDWNMRFYPDGERKESAGNASAFLANLSQAKDEVRTKFTLSMLDDHGNAQESNRCDYLPGRLERALKDGKGTDVTLLVGGREFIAHRFMLAAQSPVFDAQLFGPMTDEEDTRRIEVVDMEPAIFEMLLHYIYKDSLPSCGEKGYDAATMQHLLVAADRYGMDRLKAMCEEKLLESINVQTVTSTLALADRHFCEQLKDACDKFLSAPGIAAIVLLRNGCTRLMAMLQSGHKEEAAAAGTK
ncbi:BTB/POZ and MATH domain-containing protein 1-like [Hordeum vulgare subsp. vulgare]|uniref:BTB/POZ and MATH domain-containing protein 1-like n=1 Tax=Hordeum vulgare subsp. vulgare TaxID=112509 RepID=UPI001D1A4A76|nr:BTB/POZ and MATH domain-containing protein 1-like [Hordeum vulgare subsp. vulgare]